MGKQVKTESFRTDRIREDSGLDRYKRTGKPDRFRAERNRTDSLGRTGPWQTESGNKGTGHRIRPS